MTRQPWDSEPYYLRAVPAYRPRESWQEQPDPRDVAIKKALAYFEQAREQLTSTGKLLLCSMAEAELKRGLGT